MAAEAVDRGAPGAPGAAGRDHEREGRGGVSGDILARICAAKLEHVAACKRERSLSALERELPAERPRGFARALRAAVAEGRFGLIAEIKKASPSRGLSVPTSTRRRWPGPTRQAGRPACRC
jgi:hypothetical protein